MGQMSTTVAVSVRTPAGGWVAVWHPGFPGSCHILLGSLAGSLSFFFLTLLINTLLIKINFYLLGVVAQTSSPST